MKLYLDSLYFYQIECNIPDDEACVSIEEIKEIQGIINNDGTTKI